VSYRLSADLIGAQELADAFRRAPQITTKALSGAIGRTAFRVEAQAKQKAPIDKGILRGSITTPGPVATLGNVEASVGTNIKYARYHEEGTGIYGPKKQPIRPKNGKVLAWKSGGRWHYARQVRGVKPKWYFRQARDEARPYYTEQLRAALTEIVNQLAR
jgi:phage gpG-like protein